MKLYDSNEYRASSAWPYAVSAGSVVYRFQNEKLEVLLLKRNPGHTNDPQSKEATYMLPKGGVGIGEPIEVAAQRETEEEAGVVVELQTYLGSQIHEFTHPKHSMHNIKTTHYFASLWQSDGARMDDEHDSREWFSVKKAKEKLIQTTPERKEYEILERLEKFLELFDAA